MMDAGALPEREFGIDSSCPTCRAQAARVLQELDLIVVRATGTPCGACTVRIGCVGSLGGDGEVVTSPVFVLS